MMHFWFVSTSLLLSTLLTSTVYKKIYIRNLFCKFTVILLWNGIDEIQKCSYENRNYFSSKKITNRKNFFTKMHKNRSKTIWFMYFYRFPWRFLYSRGFICLFLKNTLLNLLSNFERFIYAKLVYLSVPISFHVQHAREMYVAKHSRNPKYIHLIICWYWRTDGYACVCRAKLEFKQSKGARTF